MLAAVISSVHLIAVLASIVGLLVILVASAPMISAQDLKAITRVYLMTGSALLVAAAAGAVLWLAVGKPAEFYNNNPVFHAKLGLFVLLLMVLVYTGFKFRQLQRTHHTALASDTAEASSAPIADTAPTEVTIQVSAAIRRMQKICIPLMIVIPALAWMMARGIGY
ncbi:MAG: DUF2214 family protein [Gammaproteobacteria bacterium]|nr:DUF2214 family protein [Gammaproteobacteria bacterium]